MRIFTLILAITTLLTGQAFAQAINSVTPNYAYQQESLTVSIVGQTGLYQNQGTWTSAYLYQGTSTSQGSSTTYLSVYNLRPGSSTLAAGLEELLGELNISAQESTGFYDLYIGSSTLSNAFYVNQNHSGPGNISGTVNQSTPKNGAPIAGLKMLLTNANTNVNLVSFTDENGAFRFDYLPGGTYGLTADGYNNGVPVIYEIGTRVSYENQEFEADNNTLNIVGVGPVAELEELSIYPTVFSNSFTVNYSLKASSTVTIDVFDALGKKVKSISNQSQLAGSHQVNVAGNFSSQAGVYFVSITINGKSVTKRLVKTN